MADNNCPFTATDQSAINPGETWVRNPAGDGYTPASVGGGAPLFADDRSGTPVAADSGDDWLYPDA